MMIPGPSIHNMTPDESCRRKVLSLGYLLFTVIEDIEGLDDKYYKMCVCKLV